MSIPNPEQLKQASIPMSDKPLVLPFKARVILDPIRVRLKPGEILVAPSTDPGWTPLFLTASGLVMPLKWHSALFHSSHFRVMDAQDLSLLAIPLP